MLVTCQKCKLSIEVTVSNFGPNSFRYGTNDSHLLVSSCAEYAARPDKSGRPEEFICQSLTDAIGAAVRP